METIIEPPETGSSSEQPRMIFSFKATETSDMSRRLQELAADFSGVLLGNDTKGFD